MAIAAGISNASKGYREATHRLVPPATTLQRVHPFASVMGITRIANVTGLDNIGIPVVMVCRPNSRSISVSQGKGYDIVSAKVSGLMESVESFHAERVSLPLKLCSLEDLKYTDSVVDVDRLPRLSDSKFTPFERLLWVKGEDLLVGGGRWVPYEMVHLDYTLPLPSGHGCFQASSNGLASGNHFLEATIHAICELIERDAVTLWHQLEASEREATRVDLNTVSDARCRKLLDQFVQAGVMVAVWEVTSDIGLPVFLCRILQEDSGLSNTVRPAAGMGCHLVREVALLRALTEAAQSRLTFIAGARDDMPRQGYEQFLDPKTYEIWRNAMAPTVSGRNFLDAPSYHGRSFDEDLRLLLDRLKSVGIEEVVAVDLTKPEFKIPVVRVIIPGLEGLDSSARYVPGERLRRQKGDGA
ncbi:MAG: YcaO-like family protein [Kiloniellales bacterium]|nr:YcaO-like family protein [Kiloniellales bacterium]